MSADKLGAIAGVGTTYIACTDKSDASSEIRVVRVAGQQRPGAPIQLRDDMHLVLLSQLTQDPFPISKDGQATLHVRTVSQDQAAELHRCIHRHVNPEFGIK